MYLVNGYTMKEVKTIEEAKAEMKKEIEKNNLSYNKVFSFTNENLVIEIYEYCTLYKETFLIIPSLEMAKYFNICPEYNILNYKFEYCSEGEINKKIVGKEIDAIIEWERTKEYRKTEWFDIAVNGCISIGKTKL